MLGTANVNSLEVSYFQGLYSTDILLMMNSFSKQCVQRTRWYEKRNQKS